MKLLQISVAIATIALLAHGAGAQTSPPKPTQAPGSQCEAGKIRCEDWCRKYRTKSTTQTDACIFFDPASCKMKYGSSDHCVIDGPPRL